MKSTLRGLVALATLASLLTMAPARPASASEPGWWNGSYAYRHGVKVVNGPFTVASGYSLSVTFDHAAMVSADRSLANGNDIRIAYFNGSSWTELDRLLQPSATGQPSAWNTTATKIWFRTQAAIGAGAKNTSYYLYYGNPAAGAPPANGLNVFDDYDDFSGTVLNTSRWVPTSNSGVTVSQSGELIIAGTNTSGDAYAMFGASRNGGVPPGTVAEVSMSVVSQSVAAHSTWSGQPGYWADKIAYGWAQQIGYYDADLNQTIPIAPSGITARTFPYQRIVEAWDPNGTMSVSENGARVASRYIPPGWSSLTLTYGPGAAGGNQTFDVRFDDFVMRKTVAIEPTVSLDASAVTTVSTVVDPSLTFVVGAHAGACNGQAQSSGASVSGAAVALGHVSTSANAVGAQDLTVTSNASGGFVVYARNTGPMANGNGYNIADVATTPASFPAVGSEAFGVTSDDADLSAFAANKWGSLSTSNRAVSQSTTPGPVNADLACVAYQVGVSGTTRAGSYSTTVIYTAVPVF